MPRREYIAHPIGPRYDVEGARAEGYTDAEIVDYISEQDGFDAPAARAEGYNDGELLEYLTASPEKKAVLDYNYSTTAGQRVGRDFKRGVTLGTRTLASALPAETILLNPEMRHALAQLGQTREEFLEGTESAIVKNVADLTRQANEIPRRPVVEQIAQAETGGAIWDTLKQDPLGAVAGFGVESFAQNLPGFAAALASGNPTVAALTIGASSALNERQGGILEHLQESGYRIEKPEGLAAALRNPEVVDEAQRYGNTRAAIIGPIDALTAGMGSKLLVPKKIITGPLARELANIPAQMAGQSTAGAGSEALAQLATTGEVGSPGEVAAEAIGEGFTAPADVLAVGRKGLGDRLEARRQARLKALDEEIRKRAAAPAAATPAAAPSAGQQPAPAAPAATEAAVPSVESTPAAPGPESLPSVAKQEIPDEEAFDFAAALDGETGDTAAPPAPGPGLDARRAGDARPRSGSDASLAEPPAAPDQGTRISNRALGRSPFEQVFRDAGLDPDKAALLPDAEKLGILRNQVREKHGIEVEIDPTLNTREAIDNLMDVHQNADAMLNVLGLPRSALTLGGKIRLRLYNRKAGVQGAEGALAYYTNQGKLIGVNRRHSAFAHEYGHAVDYHLQESLSAPTTGRGLSGDTAATNTGQVAAQVLERSGTGRAFKKLMLSMYRHADFATEIRQLEHQIERAEAALQDAIANERPTRTLKKALKDLKEQYARRHKIFAARERDSRFSKKLEGLSEYWSTPTEMIARAFEAYVSHKVESRLAEQGLTPASAEQGTQFLGMADKAYRDELNEFMQRVYPQEAERAAIFSAFDELFSAMRADGMLGARDDNIAPMPTDYGPLDPSRWNALVGKARANQARSVFAEDIAALRQLQQQFRRAILTLRNGSPKALLDAARSLRRVFLGKVSTTLLVMQKKYADIPAVGQIVRHLAYRPGDASATGAIFEEARERELKKFTNRMGRIFDTHRASEFSPEQWESVRDLLAMPEEAFRRTPARGIDPNLISMASELRRLLDDAYYYLTNAGVDFGYVRTGYFPRIVDLAQAINDPAGFKAAAEKLYRLIRAKQFDAGVTRLTKALDAFPLDEAQREAILQALEEYRRATIEGSDRRAARTARRALLDALKALQPAPGAGITPEQRAALGEIHKAFAEINEAVRMDPEKRAEAWYGEIAYGEMWDFSSGSPTAKFTNPRTLPPEADQIMRGFLITHPQEALSIYFAKIVSQAEFTRRFGPGGEKLQQWLKEARDAGMAPTDYDVFTHYIGIVFGTPQKKLLPSFIRAPFAYLEAIVTMVLLARALLTNLPEITAIAIRSGKATDSFIGLGMWVELTASRLRKMFGGELSARSQALEELSEFFGIVGSATVDAISNARYMANLDSEGSSRLAHWSATYYRRIGLHAVTTSQRKVATALGWRYLQRAAERIESGTSEQKTAARLLLQDLGLPPAKHDAVVRFLRSVGNLPTIEQVQTSGVLDELQTAIGRFVDEAIQNPKRVDRTYLANMQVPLLSGFFGLLSFSYSFANNLIIGVGRRGVTISKYAGRGEAAAYLWNTAFAFATAYAMHVLMTALRESLTNPERWERDFKEKSGELNVEKLVLLSASRMGLAGPADPLFNYLSNLKYEASSVNLVVGPVYNYLGQGVDRISGVAGRNSPNTNTAEWNAVRGAYDLLAAPAFAVMVGAAPQGGMILNPVLGITNAALTSPAVKNAVVDEIVGEKDSRKRQRARSAAQ